MNSNNWSLFPWFYLPFNMFPFRGEKSGGCHEVQKYRVYRNRLLLRLSIISAIFCINSYSSFLCFSFFLGMKLLHWIHGIYEVLKSCIILTCICYFIQSFGYTDITRSQWRTLCRLLSCRGTKLLETLRTIRHKIPAF